MTRIQFYPGDELTAQLDSDAKRMGISTSALVVDLLERHYHLHETDKLTMPEMTGRVLEEIAAYVRDPRSEKEFDLSVSDTFRSIQMVCDGRPQTVRARIGRSFAAQVGRPGPFQAVAIAYKPNGKIKKSADNATRYIIQDDKRLEETDLEH